MKNIVEYEAPAIEVSEVRLECGIAASIRRRIMLKRKEFGN